MHRDTLAGGSCMRYVEDTCVHGLLSRLLRSVVFDGTREAECPAARAPRASGPGPQGMGHPGHSRALQPAWLLVWWEGSV